MYARYTAGSILKNIPWTFAPAPLDFFGIEITWSKSNDRVRAFSEGVQQGIDLNGLGVWAGTLDSTTSLIAASSNAPLNPWDGGTSDVILANNEATPTQIATIDSKLADGSLTNVDLNIIFGADNWVWWKPNDVCDITCDDIAVPLNPTPTCDQTFLCDNCESFHFLDWDDSLLYYDEDYWFTPYNNNSDNNRRNYPQYQKDETCDEDVLSISK